MWINAHTLTLHCTKVINYTLKQGIVPSVSHQKGLMMQPCDGEGVRYYLFSLSIQLFCQSSSNVLCSACFYNILAEIFSKTRSRYNITTQSALEINLIPWFTIEIVAIVLHRFSSFIITILNSISLQAISSTI